MNLFKLRSNNAFTSSNDDVCMCVIFRIWSKHRGHISRRSSDHRKLSGCSHTVLRRMVDKKLTWLWEWVNSDPYVTWSPWTERFITVSIYTICGTDTPYVFAFTACFGLMWPSSGTLGLTHNHLFIFLLLSLHWPVFIHWECVVCMVLCDTLCFETY
jgi:hypothetical protein